jgi:hypothetical protein
MSITQSGTSTRWPLGTHVIQLQVHEMPCTRSSMTCKCTKRHALVHDVATPLAGHRGRFRLRTSLKQEISKVG